VAKDSHEREQAEARERDISNGIISHLPATGAVPANRSKSIPPAGRAGPALASSGHPSLRIAPT